MTIVSRIPEWFRSSDQRVRRYGGKICTVSSLVESLAMVHRI